VADDTEQDQKSSTFTVSARTEVVAEVRRQVVFLAQKMPFMDQDIEDIKLAVGEAVSNAVKHGSPMGESSRITVHCEQTGNRFIVEIGDEGPGFDLASKVCTSPGGLEECGRGLFFMRQLMDRVSVTSGSGAIVRLEKQVGQNETPPED
jgi:serine/threonine-protein kinase RsbW